MSSSSKFTIKKWILVVEDEPALRNLIGTRLELKFGKNLNIVHAEDGMIASRMLTFQSFDMIITDLRMPNRMGQPFISAARMSAMNSDTPIVIITSNPDEAIPEKFSGVVQFEKPVHFPTLLSLVDRELNIGKTDQRIAADLLNLFIEIVKAFLEKLQEESVKLIPPVRKQKSDSLAGDHIQIIEFSARQEKCIFALGFNAQAMTTLKRKLKKADELSNESLASITTQMIFEKAQKSLGSSGARLTLHKNISSDNSSNLTGLVVPIHFGRSQLFVYSLNQAQHTHKGKS